MFFCRKNVHFNLYLCTFHFSDYTRYALNIETEKLPADFYENYIRNINAVTPEQVQQAANKYFLIDNTRIVIAGKGSDVLPGFEKLNIPILHFDKYGNPIEKPIAKKEVPAGVTAKIVLDNTSKLLVAKKQFPL